MSPSFTVLEQRCFAISIAFPAILSERVVRNPTSAAMAASLTRGAPASLKMRARGAFGIRVVCFGIKTFEFRTVFIVFGIWGKEKFLK
jgi:hypothetical protein